MYDVVIYDPPREGLPFLMATFSPEGPKVLEARTRPVAFELAAMLKKQHDRNRRRLARAAHVREIVLGSYDDADD